MGDAQPVEPEVQLLGDPVVPVVNPPVGQNENENVAQPQELEVVVFQSLLYASWYILLCLSPLLGFFFSSYSEAEGMLKGFGTDHSLLSKLVPEVADLVGVVSS